MEPTSQTTPTSRSTDQADSTPGRRLDPLALFAGLVFVAVAVVGLTDRIVLTVTDLRWIGPILLVAFGIVLVATAAGGRNDEPSEASEDDQAG